MERRASDTRTDDQTSDDWLGDQGDVDWSGEPSTQPARSRSGAADTSTARMDAAPASGGRFSSYDPRRLTVVQRRRAVALVVLVALVLLGIAVAVTVFGSDESGAPVTTAAATTTQRPVTEPPAATTAPPVETPAPLTIELPESGQLAVGDSGEEVETLQTALVALELDAGAVDGVFGAATQDAVRAFQEANDLAADGIVGASTAEKLNEALAAQGVTR